MAKKEVTVMNYQDLEWMALQGLPLTRDQCYAVLHSPEGAILELLQAAFRVREKYFGRKVTIHFLLNAKSGLCPEDCTYCSQSALSHADIQKYPMLDEERILKGAHLARAAKAKRYCIVTSGRAPTQRELERIYRVVSRIKQGV